MELKKLTSIAQFNRRFFPQQTKSQAKRSDADAGELAQDFLQHIRSDLKKPSKAAKKRGKGPS